MAKNDEINEIIDLIGEEPTEQPAEGSEEEVEAEASGEKSSEESSEAEVEGSEEGSEEAEEGSSEESSEESEEKDEVTLLKEQNEKLKQKLNEVASQTQTQQTQKFSEESSEESQSEEQKPSAAEKLKEYDFDSLMEDKEKFFGFVEDLVSSVRSETEEQVMRKIPQVVQSTAQEQIEVRERARDFYKNNPDLANSKPFVATTVNQVSSEHPDWTTEQVLEETANRARDALGLEKKAAQAEKDQAQEQSQSSRKPAFAGSSKKSSQRKGSDQRTELEKEIDDIL